MQVIWLLYAEEIDLYEYVPLKQKGEQAHHLQILEPFSNLIVQRDTSSENTYGFWNHDNAHCITVF
jgi:hypothetical protein